MHLGLIAGAILICFRFLRVKSRLTLLLLLSLYVGTVGDVVSLHRAYTMAALLIAASLFHRPLNLLSALGNAVFLILIWWPHMIYSVAFQLSCLATFAVILSIRRFNIARGRNLLGKLRSYAVSTLVVSAFVQVFVVPLLIHHFGCASVVSPIATLIFFPFVLVVLFLSLFCVLLGAIWSSAGSLIAVVLCPLVDVFQSLLQRASELAPPPVHFPNADILLYCAGLTLAWFSKGRSAKTLIGLVLVIIAFLKCLVVSE
jgi:ComEC/Rec2-related protein